MFGTIRKHQTWLWAVIIAVITISMVAFFSNDVSLSGKGSRSSGGEFGSIDGKPISDTEFRDAYKEVKLGEFLRTGKWPGSEESSSRMLERQTINRVYLIHKMRQMDIDVSEKAIALIVQEQIHDYPYERFEAEFLKPNGLSVVDYERFVRHEAGIRQLVAAAASSARLVNPKDAEALWKKENQEYKVKVAVFAASNFLSKVTITNGAIETFFTNRQAFYRLPERVVIDYVAFSASNFLAEADAQIAKQTNIEAVVNGFYANGGTNVWKETNGVPMPEAVAKEKIRMQVRLNQGLLAARRAAAEFGNELMNQPDPNKVSTFERVAAEKKFVVRTSQPFDRTSGLDEFANERVPASREDEAEPVALAQVIREKALTLTDERPVLFNGIPGTEGVYIIARKARIPSEVRPFEAVKAKVIEDYKNMLAQDMARKAGMTFHTNLTNGLTLKKSFDELAAAEKVNVLDIPPFSASTKSLPDEQISVRVLQNVAANLETGHATPFYPQAYGGIIVYLASRPAIDDKKMAADIDEFTGTLRQYRQGEAFNNWFRKEAERDHLAFPAQKEPSVTAK